MSDSERGSDGGSQKVFKGALNWDDWIWWCAIGGVGLLILLLLLCCCICTQRAKRKGRQEAMAAVQARERDREQQEQAQLRYAQAQQQRYPASAQQQSRASLSQPPPPQTSAPMAMAMATANEPSFRFSKPDVPSHKPPPYSSPEPEMQPYQAYREASPSRNSGRQQPPPPPPQQPLGYGVAYPMAPQHQQYQPHQQQPQQQQQQPYYNGSLPPARRGSQPPPPASQARTDAYYGVPPRPPPQMQPLAQAAPMEETTPAVLGPVPSAAERENRFHRAKSRVRASEGPTLLQYRKNSAGSQEATHSGRDSVQRPSSAIDTFDLDHGQPLPDQPFAAVTSPRAGGLTTTLPLPPPPPYAANLQQQYQPQYQQQQPQQPQPSPWASNGAAVPAIPRSMASGSGSGSTAGSGFGSDQRLSSASNKTATLRERIEALRDGAVQDQHTRISDESSTVPSSGSGSGSVALGAKTHSGSSVASSATRYSGPRTSMNNNHKGKGNGNGSSSEAMLPPFEEEAAAFNTARSSAYVRSRTPSPLAPPSGGEYDPLQRNGSDNSVLSGQFEDADSSRQGYTLPHQQQETRRPAKRTGSTDSDDSIEF